VLVEERDLGPVRDPLDPARGAFLENRLLFTTHNATVAVPGAGGFSAAAAPATRPDR
jgi:hypothetical protein